MIAAVTAPTLAALAQRLIRHCTQPSLDAGDLVQEARIALHQQRDRIAERPDPLASAYTLSRKVMWAAVQRANAGRGNN